MRLSNFRHFYFMKTIIHKKTLDANLRLVGKQFKTKENDLITILKFENGKRITISFQDGTIVENITISNIRSGTIKNKNNKSIYGIGFIGYGKHIPKNNAVAYKTWKGVFNRCYNKNNKNNVNYLNVITICENWHNYQNFAEWFENNYIVGFELDKDILIDGNKIYSPNTCCFVPQEINNIFKKNQKKKYNLPIGVFYREKSKKYISMLNNKTLGYYENIEDAFNCYKKEKENYYKKIADKWKDRISIEVYNILYNKEV